MMIAMLAQAMGAGIQRRSREEVSSGPAPGGPGRILSGAHAPSPWPGSCRLVDLRLPQHLDGR
jgi:hypothetical protein